MHRHAIRNGVLIGQDEALVPVTDRAVQSSFSVYEALRVVDRHVVHLDDHITRMEYSASAIGLALPDADWQTWIDMLVAADDIVDATMRITVYGTAQPLAFITWQDLLTYPDEYYDRGIAVTTFHGERFLPTCKTGNLLLSYLALEDAHSKGAFESLLVDREGRVLEGSRSNFYLIRGNVMYTAADDLVLGGVTRKSVMRAARQLGLETVMQAVGEDELLAGDTMFISSTSMAAMPVTKVDGRAVPCDIGLVASICALVRKWEIE